MESINTPTEVTFSPGNITVDNKPIEAYMSSLTDDPFLPELQSLPPFTADDIFQQNVGAFQSKNKEQWPVVANKIIDDYLKKSPERILGTPSNNETNTSFSVRAEEKRGELVNKLLEQARQTQQ
jgi:hypothetical protein